MSVGVVVGLLCISVILIVISVATFKYHTDDRIESLDIKVNYLDIFYHSLDKRWSDMYDTVNMQTNQSTNIVDIIKMQQEEIKELKRMIEPKEKKCCCGNCRFYHELNERDSVCLNVDVNNCHKAETTLYANNMPFSCWTIKGVKPNECCEYYEPKEKDEWA